MLTVASGTVASPLSKVPLPLASMYTGAADRAFGHGREALQGPSGPLPTVPIRWAEPSALSMTASTSWLLTGMAANTVPSAALTSRATVAPTAVPERPDRGD